MYHFIDVKLSIYYLTISIPYISNKYNQDFTLLIQHMAGSSFKYSLTPHAVKASYTHLCTGTMPFTTASVATEGGDQPAPFNSVMRRGWGHRR